MDQAVPVDCTLQREVTLLFADMRSFTELAGSFEFDPLACELQSHVMDCLTDSVLEHDGHIVDYYGDGLVAMWNAPSDQSEHADLACSTALEMLDSLPAVSADWMVLIQRELRLGIGVHTGLTQVGNAGSSRQAKYGPRGPNVHLASRVEAATKELRVPFVATQPTIEQLSDCFTANRICRAQLPGLQQPIDLYAVRPSADDPRLAAAWKNYEEALRHFEDGRFNQAADILASIDQAILKSPTQFLVEQVHNALSREFRRRSTDQPRASQSGVVTVSEK